MSAEEIVRGLRDSLPPKIDYAELVCAEGFAHGQHYVWDDPLPYLIEQAAALIESQAAEMAKLLERIAELEGQLTEEISRRYQAECNYDHWKATCEQVRAQLTASQQETRALLDDIAHDMACGICAHCSVSLVNEPCASCRGNSSKFEWRGHQEAGEEKA